MVDGYDEMISNGIAPEVARGYLPQNTYTEIIVTGSLYYWSRVYTQRTDPHAQKEIQELAQMIGEIVEPLFPESWTVLT